MRLHLQLGDITAMNVEAIVNSTDTSLLDGGPIHAAVHTAAGPALRAECEALGECPVGEARFTAGYNLGTKHIIHTVAPMWQGGGCGEDNNLACCYRNALVLAESLGVRSLAFPSIGSGLQPQIPLERAAPVAVSTIMDYLKAHALPEKVVLVCFDVPTFQAYQRAMKEALP